MPGRMEFESFQTLLSDLQAAVPPEHLWTKDAWESLRRCSGPLVDAAQDLVATLDEALKEAKEAEKASVEAAETAQAALAEHEEGSSAHEEARTAHDEAQKDRQDDEDYVKACDKNHHHALGLLAMARDVDRGGEAVLEVLEKGWHADGSEIPGGDGTEPHFARAKAKAAVDRLPHDVKDMTTRAADCFDADALAADGPPVTYD